MEKPRIKIIHRPHAALQPLTEFQPAPFDSIVDTDPYSATEKLRKQARWTRRKGKKKHER